MHAKSSQTLKESLAVLAYLSLIPLFIAIWIQTVLWLLFPLSAIPTALYLAYVWLYNRSYETGDVEPSLRSSSVWNHFENYFPINVHPEVPNLDTNDRYVFAYHPHGVIGLGAFGANATAFPRLFPGLDLRLLTLEMNVKTPFLREFFLRMGICGASRKTCDTLLGQNKSIMLVVGGAKEALEAHPGTARLTLQQRKGFVRVALHNRAKLVPMFGFGENDVFESVDNPRGSLLRRMQDKLQGICGFSMPIFSGVGIHAATGFLPRRRPINIVVGEPLDVPEVPPELGGKHLYDTAEGRELVDKYHQLYITKLTELYNKHKNKFALQRRESLKVE